MSQGDELDPYFQTGVAGAEHRDIDAAGEGHPFGDEPKEWQADLRPLIRQVADDLYDTWEATVREYLANAETACLKIQDYVEEPEASPFDDVLVEDSYEPVIEVTWDRSKQKLIIQDNGIGMAAVEVDQVFRHIGRSAARDLGTRGGAFGMGALSFSKFIGTGNTMVMKSHSRLNDDNACYLVTLAGIEPAHGSLDDDQYGTRFELDQKSNDMDIRKAVERYAKNMRVPVIYRELDENGVEVFNEDWGDEKLIDRYTEGIYVDRVMSPGGFIAYMTENATKDTLLLSMPIERNAGGKDSPVYSYDVRILDESGKIIECGCEGVDHTGLIPMPRLEYGRVLVEERSNYIPRSKLGDATIVGQEAVTEDGDEVVIVDSETLMGDVVLPQNNYVADAQNVKSFGPEIALTGEYSGRIVVDDEEWDRLPQGRAAQFVPEDELEPFDADERTGDLRLPQPTTDRSSLQSNDEFWKHITNQFNERFNERIDEYHDLLQSYGDDYEQALDEMNPPVASDWRKD